MRISFDFDGVLDTEEGQEFFRSLAHANWLAGPNGTTFQIFIVTTRFKDEIGVESKSKILADRNDDIWNFVRSIQGLHGIKVNFTNHEWKWKTLDDLGIDIHIDDNPDECHLINEKCEKCSSLLFGLNIHKLLMEGTEL